MQYEIINCDLRDYYNIWWTTSQNRSRHFMCYQILTICDHKEKWASRQVAYCSDSEAFNTLSRRSLQNTLSPTKSRNEVFICTQSLFWRDSVFGFAVTWGV
jgi:hypothetical protein